VKLSLVTCPVAVLPVTSETAKISFHTLNRATGNRVQSRYVDAETKGFTTSSRMTVIRSRVASAR
jgi:DNA end-binding protein Ku